MHSSVSKYLLYTSILLVAIFTIVAIARNESVQRFYQQELQERHALEQQLLAESETDFTVGSEDPKVRLVVYTDTDCPFCKRFEPELDRLLHTYPEDVAITYRHTKFSGLYPSSRYEHLALECVGIIAGAQAYKEFQNEYLFENKFPDDGDFTDRAIDMATSYLGEKHRSSIQNCVNDSETEERVQKKVDSGHVLGIRLTPSWFIVGENIDETHLVTGQYFYDDVVERINQALAPDGLSK